MMPDLTFNSKRISIISAWNDTCHCDGMRQDARKARAIGRYQVVYCTYITMMKGCLD